MEQRTDAVATGPFDIQSEENTVPIVLASGKGYKGQCRPQANKCNGNFAPLKKRLNSGNQKIRSCLRRLPKPPTLAMMNESRYWFSLRVPKENRRNCTLNPQQSVL